MGDRGRVHSPPGVAAEDNSEGTREYAVSGGQEGRKQRVWRRKNGTKEKWATRNRTRTTGASVTRTARDMDSGPLPQSQWSLLHTVETTPFRLRKHPMRFPPLAVIGCFPPVPVGPVRVEDIVNQFLPGHLYLSSRNVAASSATWVIQARGN